MLVTAPMLEPTDLKLHDTPRVARIAIDEMIDSVGDPALRVAVTLEPKPGGGDYHWLEVKPIEREIFRVLRERGETRFPYVSFNWFDLP